MESAFSLRPDNKKQTVRRCGSMRGAPKRKSEQPVVNHLGDPCIWLRDLQHFDGPPFRRLGESESTGWKLSLLHLFGGEGGLNKSALLDCVEYLPTWNFLIFTGIRKSSINNAFKGSRKSFRSSLIISPRQLPTSVIGRNGVNFLVESTEFPRRVI